MVTQSGISATAPARFRRRETCRDHASSGHGTLEKKAPTEQTASRGKTKRIHGNFGLCHLSFPLRRWHKLLASGPGRGFRTAFGFEYSKKSVRLGKNLHACVRQICPRPRHQTSARRTTGYDQGHSNRHERQLSGRRTAPRRICLVDALLGAADRAAFAWVRNDRNSVARECCGERQLQERGASRTKRVLRPALRLEAPENVRFKFLLTGRHWHRSVQVANLKNHANSS